MNDEHSAAGARAPRKDTARNRRALIDAAREAFAREGFDAPLEPIATAAGLGNATLYRHFPTRAALWSAVVTEPMEEILAMVTESLDDGDPWAALRHYLIESCAMEARRGGFTALMTTHFAGAPLLLELRARIQEGIDTLVSRALAAGAIRGDVVETDFAMITVGMTEIIRTTRAVAPDAWQRHLGIVLDGLRSPDPVRLRASPLTRNHVWRALMRGR